MQIKIIKIGNSKGIVIPASILKLSNIKESVNLVVDKNNIILEPIKEEHHAKGN